MKLKKFFAGVLAAAMMLTVGATAVLAEGPTASVASKDNIPNTAITSDTQIKIYKTYDVKSGAAPTETFSFDIDYVEKFDSDSQASDPMVRKVNGKSVTFNGPVTGSNNVGYFTLTPAELGLAAPAGTGKYVYTIKETAGSTPAVSYDNKTLYLIVSVVHKVDDNNNIKSGYDYYVTLRRDSKTGEKAENNFTNTYGDGNLKELALTKTVRGSFGDLGETFTFNVQFTGDTSKYAGVSIKSVSANASVKDSKDAPVTGLMALNTDYTVTLKHGEKVEFSNLPDGIGYVISENGSEWNTVNSVKVAKKDQYIVSLETGDLTDNTAGKPVAQGSIVTEKNASVGFINDHQGTPDMGVVLDNAPYIAMLAIVAIGGVALMLNKRRRDEE